MDAQLVLVAVLVDARIHVLAAVQVVAMVIAMVVLAAKDAVITVKQIAAVGVKNAVMLTALVIVADLVDLPASHYVEIAKILVIIHALAIADQNVQIAVTLTVLDHAKAVVQAVVTPTVVVAVRVVPVHAKEIVQVAVMVVPVNSFFNRPCGMRCYK